MSLCDNEASFDDASVVPLSPALSSAEVTPLLRIPTADASPDEWASVIPLSELPRMPGRGSGYYLEPICGVCLVCIICVTLVGITTSTAIDQVNDKRIAWVLISLIWTWAALALGSMSFILFGNAGVVKRTPEVCYPIPEAVATRLIEGRSLDGMKNINGATRGSSYCVRCHLWRHKHNGDNHHHCNTCQRCVTGFDHHCGVFGRCIVSANMPCFITLISMCFCGMVTTVVTIMGSADSHRYRYEQNFHSTYQGPILLPATPGSLASTLAPMFAASTVPPPLLLL